MKVNRISTERRHRQTDRQTETERDRQTDRDNVQHFLDETCLLQM